MIKKLKIDEQLRDLLPPLTKDEFEQLEKNILKDGCRDPLITWKGYIVDGHNRYNICQKHNIEFKEIVLAYEDKDDIIQWMVDTQLGRRNLTPIQRIKVAEKYRYIYEKKAKKNKEKAMAKARLENSKVTDEFLLCPISDKTEKIDTKKELAKIAGVGHDTYNKGKKILESDNEEVKQKVISGELKINTAYNELFGKKKEDNIKNINNDLPKKNNQSFHDEKINKQETKEEVLKVNTKVCKKCKEEKQLGEFYINHDECKICEQDKVTSKPKNNNEIFKDINGSPLLVKDEIKMNDSEFNELLKDIKTPKDYQSYADPVNEIELIDETCEDLIWQIDSKLFTLNNLIEKMNKINIDSLVSVLDKHLEEINNIKLKLIKIKGNK